MTVIFLTHAEVVIDPDLPVPEWPLNALGRARHARFARDPALAGVGTIFCSAEQKARDGADLTAEVLGASPRVREGLGENDRSATGYLPGPEFQATADRFFANPEQSIRGWERAADAQTRIFAAVRDALAEPRPEGDVLFVAHGGVATLLRCHLAGIEITRKQDQTGGGGNWFAFAPDMTTAPTEWRAI
ncbi:MAG: phosphoglycerate mutase family protein [Oceanicola sp.]|nr:phosphoglycerate mutase family protein [Oceanicola sp.]